MTQLPRLAPDKARLQYEQLGGFVCRLKKDICLSLGLLETSRECAITVKGFLPIDMPSILERVRHLSVL